MKYQKNKNIYSIFLLLFSSTLLISSLPYQKLDKALRDEAALLRSKRKYSLRSNWIKVINEYIAIERKYPKYSKSDDSLLNAAKLYIKLAKFSGQKKDLKEARKILKKIYTKYKKSNSAAEAMFLAGELDERLSYYSNASKVFSLLIKKYPQTKWARKAIYKNKKNRHKTNNKPITKNGKQDWQNAEKLYNKLISSGKKQFRDNWFKVLKKYTTIVKEYPKSNWELQALFKISFIYEQLYRYGLDDDDLYSAIDYYNNIIERFPNNKRTPEAIWKSAILYEKLEEPVKAFREYKLIISKYKKSDYYKKSKAKYNYYLKKINQRKEKILSNDIKIKGVRYWSSKNYTRVVIYGNKPLTYTQHYLKSDPKLKKLPRLYFDLHNATIVQNIEKQIAIEDGLLFGARIGQFNSKTVRVVLDLMSVQNYNVFTLDDPFRIIIDIFGNKKIAHQKKNQEKTKKEKQPQIFTERPYIIVLDPGHGGKDTGAIGNGLKEKDLTLSIAHKLARILRQEMNAKVLFTRETDIFIPLEERTAFANTKDADIFVSIHINSSPKKRGKLPKGIETYYLGRANNRMARLVAKVENNAGKSDDALGKLILTLNKKFKTPKSIKLASIVQKETTANLNEYNAIGRGVFGAPFYVLLNTAMPSILVECGFINNPKEAKLLNTPLYQEQIAHGIANGIENFLNGTARSY